MAVTPKTDEAFLREVDEELRRDQIVGVWTQHGRLILSAIVGGLLDLRGRARVAVLEPQQGRSASRQAADRVRLDRREQARRGGTGACRTRDIGRAGLQRDRSHDRGQPTVQ